MDSWIAISSALVNLLYGYLCAIIPFRITTLSSFFRNYISFAANVSKPRVYLLIGIILGLLILFGVRSCVYSEPHEKTYYRVARDSTWYPTELYGKEKNMIAFSNDLITEIAQREKIRIELLIKPSGTLLHGLDYNEYDGILSSLAPNVNTRDFYEFSDPFYLLGPVLVVPAKSTIKSLKDLEGETIGVLSASPTIYSVQHYANIELRSYDNVLHAFNDLENNVIDGVLIDALLAYTYTISGLYSGKLIVATAPLTEDGLRLVAHHDKSGEKLIKSFNAGLKSTMADGTYDALLRKWELFNTHK